MLSAPQNGGLLCIGGDTKLGRQSIAARKSKSYGDLARYGDDVGFISERKRNYPKRKKLYPYETIWI